MKYTKGDWHLQEVLSKKDGSSTGSYCVWAEGIPKIATVHLEHVSVNEVKANAMLIVTAPKLLEACKNLIKGQSCQDHSEAVAYIDLATTQAQAAIAKTEKE